MVLMPSAYPGERPQRSTTKVLRPTFKAFAIKSRMHFRRGFYDSGYAKTILLVEPDEPFVGTVRLEALDYKYLKLDKFYPHGKNVTYP